MGYSTCISLILLASIVGPVCPWILQATHQNIIPGLTDDVTLNCFHNPKHSYPIDLEYITRIRLLKQDITRGNWTALAEVTQPHTTTVNVFSQSDSIQLDGRIGNLSTTFLKVTWPKSTSGTVGSYKCEIDGFVKGHGADGVIESHKVYITSHPASVADLLKVIIQMKKRSNELSNELKRKSAQHEVLKKGIRKEIQSNIEDNYFESRYWPTESYSLLAPESGCPDTTSSSMIAGSVTFQTETHKGPNHTFSDPNHLGETVKDRFGSRNILKFNFCSSKRTEPRLMWPKGSYCIHYTGACPTGFTYGYMYLYPESIMKIIETRKDVFHSIVGSSTFMQHMTCCRSDGNADEPIRLPALKPFYLYRYKGKCQKVFNMDVSEEWFQIDTDDSKTDKYSNTYHPDGKVNDARFELCYYTKTLAQ